MNEWWNNIWAEKGRKLYHINRYTGDVTEYHDMTGKQFACMMGFILLAIIIAVPLGAILGNLIFQGIIKYA